MIQVNVDEQDYKDMRARAFAMQTILQGLDNGVEPTMALKCGLRHYINKDVPFEDFKCFNCRYFVPDTHETDALCRKHIRKVDYKDVCPDFITDEYKGDVYEIIRN